MISLYEFRAADTSQLKRLSEAKHAKQRQDRKRANEKKARDLLKLQLNMTAPDLETEDLALGGEEVFDLGEGEREAKRQGKSRSLGDLVEDADGMDADSEEAESDVAEDDDEVFDSDEERELKLGALEGELDDLYGQYKDRMSERDAKWKVKQARNKDKNFDAWHGIREGSDSENDGVDKGYRDGMVRAPRRGDADEDDGEESEEGGWDVTAAVKAKLGEEADSSDDDEEGDNVPAEKPKKKIVKFERSVVAPKPVAGGSRLVTSLQEPEQRAQMSRQAQVWFDQSVFKGVGDLAALDGDDEEDDEEMEDDADDESLEEDEDVDMEEASTLSSTLEDEEVCTATCCRVIC